jgi:hypothetical protein
VPRLREDKQHKTLLRAFSLHLSPSWQLNKFLPSRGMKERLETELSTMAILETSSGGERRQQEETHPGISY